MSTTTDCLRVLEESLLDPAVRRNREAVRGLLMEEFVEFGASGRVWSRDQILDLLAEETFSPVRMEDFQCVLLGDDAALVTYRAVRDARGDTGAGTSSLRSSIWIRISGKWRCRFHQGTRSS